jgi:hypothetical protein
MTVLFTPPRFDRAFFIAVADWLAVGVAVALPWSTSATGIFIGLWLVVVLPTLDLTVLRRELLTPAGGVPVLLWCLGALGMSWADVDWASRLGGLDGFMRLLAIPLLLAQFRRSGRGGWAACALLISSTGVLLASFVMVLTPGSWSNHVSGIPVHDDIFQGSLFLNCGFGALGYAILEGRRLERRVAWMLFVIGALFLANFAFVVISRAAGLVVPVVALLLGWRVRRWTGVLGVGMLTVALGSVGLLLSPSLHKRMTQSIEEIKVYQATNTGTSIGEHIAFLKESLAIVASAPMIGHGTGSIPEEFRLTTAGKSGVSGEATVNPHNQTFAVAIQVGLVGALVLWAMWISHFMLLRESDAVSWFGTVIVVENIVSSFFHSHLFDFNNGWLYVFGVGVMGGTALRQRDAISAKPAVSV